MTNRQSGADMESKGPGRPRDEGMAGAVLNAVVELVAERGMAELTMTAVAARAQVSKPAIYRRWPTKQDLVIAAAESRVGALAVPDLGNFRDELRELLTARLRQYRAPGIDRLLAGVIGAAAEAGVARRAYGAYTSRVTGETRRILERGIARGDVRPDTDVAAAATLVAGSLLFRMLAEQDAPDTGLVDAVVDMVARAVGAEG
ncbi:TetR/AcrR family transcriptional regulator [Streptomyces roseolus]|uniref:TetR/AcrR family transcriptional regulator n=1 Tax=Streptomyces roseolus TaxID=67358 RepID=UPI0019994A68|nr:TetR/AcrR family transcriptional regulator [Streptomyces roseolus]GGR41154.1 TetR family transcriptional regulator [Streptomyces roseolus]